MTGDVAIRTILRPTLALHPRTPRLRASARSNPFALLTITIEKLERATGEDIRALAELLVDTVDSGSAVSFLAPLPVETAEEWWRRTITTAPPRAIVLVARDGGRIVGTVQLQPSWAPNQPHRGDIAKLIVHRRARRTGLGSKLMQQIEADAASAGYRLLTLDTRRGDGAEQLYHKLGWTRVGVIPRYAVDPDGRTPHDTVIFYKELPG